MSAFRLQAPPRAHTILPVVREQTATPRRVVVGAAAAVMSVAALALPSEAHVVHRPNPLGGGSVMKVAPVTVIEKAKPKPPPAPRPRPRPLQPPTEQEPPAPEPVTSPAVSLRVISFNVLGSSHTRGRSGRPAGVARVGGAAQLVRGADIVGLQELQRDQAASMGRRLPSYEIFPGNSMSARDAHNSVMWRSDLFTPLERNTIGIPYHRGRIWQMPYVRLRHVSGAELWVANFHNPASTKRAGNNARWRRVAVQKEIALARALHTDGTPVVFTGDFNDRGEFFCPIARSGALRAANGGDVGPGFCRVPAGAPIDWIVGSPDISWSGYTVNRGGLVRWTSDHPLVAATATLPEQVLNEEELAAAGVD